MIQLGDLLDEVFDVENRTIKKGTEMNESKPAAEAVGRDAMREVVRVSRVDQAERAAYIIVGVLAAVTALLAVYASGMLVGWW